MAYKIIRNLYMAYQEGSEIVAILDSAADLPALAAHGTYAAGSVAMVAGGAAQTYVVNASGEWQEMCGSGGASGSGVQPDWNQNDPSAPDYVKNRPFYYDGKSVTWDGDTSGKASFDDEYYKVSDLTPTAEELVGAIYIFDGIKHGPLSSSNIRSAGQVTALFNDVVVAYADNADGGDITVPEKGIYFRRRSGAAPLAVRAAGESAAPHVSLLAWGGEVVKIPDDYLNPQYLEVKERYGIHTADRFVSDIEAAYLAGKRVRLKMLDGRQATCVDCDGDSAVFVEEIDECTYRIYGVRDNTAINEMTMCHFPLVTVGSEMYPLVTRKGLAIRSSTPGSSKRFVVSVDDSGAISAQEVTG